MNMEAIFLTSLCHCKCGYSHKQQQQQGSCEDCHFSWSHSLTSKVYRETHQYWLHTNNHTFTVYTYSWIIIRPWWIMLQIVYLKITASTIAMVKVVTGVDQTTSNARNSSLEGATKPKRHYVSHFISLRWHTFLRIFFGLPNMQISNHGL